MIPVSRPHFAADEEAAVVAALRSGWVTQGPRVAEFERAFAAALGQPEAIAVSSCTTGLHLVLHALGIGRGDEVVVPSLSFIATAVYEDGAALERQESRPEVHKVMAILPESLAAPLERTIFDASLDPALV